MITVHDANTRGISNFGWLESRHTFSFGSYHNPNRMGFGPVRVINDDRVDANRGFAEHPHRDMEIISYVVEGQLAHKDSMGNVSTIGPGMIQRMTAGSGVRHSEFNPSRTDATRFLQIWIEPSEAGLTPSYEDRTIFENGDRGVRLLASPDGRDGSTRVHQDVTIHAVRLGASGTHKAPIAAGRRVWVQVVSGSVIVNGAALHEGDAAALVDEADLAVVAGSDEAEALVFDVP